MNWLWIPCVIAGAAMALVVILRPAWLMRGKELTDSKREKAREAGMTMLGACALNAWPDLIGRSFPYVFGPIAVLWLILNFKTISRDIVNATVAVGVALWLILSLVLRFSN
jgi:hypothetical protein